MTEQRSLTTGRRFVDSCFAVRDGVLAASRLPTITATDRRVSAAELFLLLLCGATAAFAQGYVRLGLGIPGHAIVLTAIPMALGLAFAPRRLAGSMMSAGAFGTAALLTAFGGARYGGGSFVSLCLLGPTIDVALAGTRRPWRLYFGLVLAGTVTNLLAFSSRGGAKLLGFDLPGTRPFATWWSEALLTYIVSGGVAGLLAALFWFRLRAPGEEAPRPEPQG